MYVLVFQNSLSIAAMTSSARVLSANGKNAEKEDLLRRSKKKVRPCDEEEDFRFGKDSDSSQNQVVMGSYKAKCLNLFGEEVPEKIDVQGLLEQESIASVGQCSLVGTGVEIPLSDEEWSTWSMPW